MSLGIVGYDEVLASMPVKDIESALKKL